MREVTEALAQLLAEGSGGALATVIRSSGSAPQRPGARLLLTRDGRRFGTVGGGAIERVVLEALRAAFERGEGSVLRRDLGRDLGMCCGGSMEVFIEPVLEVPRLWLLGAGHIAQPTAGLARSVGFEVTVVDEREEWNTATRFEGCERHPLDAVSALRKQRFTRRDWLLIVTHDHQLDEELLRLALARGEARYVGLVGSRRKVYRLLARVAARQGLGSLERLYAPVGLDLGAVTPEEIAVSIVAELVAVRRGRPTSQSLRASEDPVVQRLQAGQGLSDAPTSPGAESARSGAEEERNGA